MAWNNIYGEFLRNFETTARLYQEEYTKNIERIINLNDELYKQFIKSNEQINELYKQYFDNIQKINQQWAKVFWRPVFKEEEKRKT
jgi:hypothetical protein